MLALVSGGLALTGTALALPPDEAKPELEPGLTKPATPPAEETVVLPSGSELTGFPAASSDGMTLDRGCPNTTACIYRLANYDDTMVAYGATSSSGGPWEPTPFPVRSAKNRFNNRRVILGSLVGPGDIGQKICINAGQNRPGPFAPAREYIKIGATGVNC